jgi:amino acid transporter
MTDQLEPVHDAPSAHSDSCARRPHGGRLRGDLSTFDIVVMVLAYAGPLAVVGLLLSFVVGYGVGAATPLVFLLVTAGLGVFAVGYVSMSRHLPRPGGLYTYVTAGLGRPVGLSAGLLAMLTYLYFGVTYHVGLAIVLQAAITEFGGPVIPWPLLVATTLVLTCVLGHFRITCSARILSALMVVEVVAILVWDTAVFLQGGPQGDPFDAFALSGLGEGSLSLALVFAAVGFVGFEATAIFRDEMRDPARTIPRATYFAVASIGLFYVLAAWAAVVAYGPAAVGDAARDDPAGFFTGSVETYLGSVAVHVVSVMLVMSYVAGAISEQSILSRYFHALGSDGVLPEVVGRVHVRHGSPHVANLVTTITLAVLFVPWVIGSEPTTPYSVLGGAGVLTLNIVLALTSIAVFVYFRRRDTARGGIWTTAVAPIAAAVLLVTVTVLALRNFEVLTGDDGWLSVVLQLVTVATFVLGVGLALVLRRRRPEVYRRIGRRLV